MTIDKKLTWDDISPGMRVERVERALKVATDMSEHEIDKHFRMSTFAKRTPCGTVGCMAGQCAFDPWFHRRGLEVRFAGRSSWSYKWVGQSPLDFFGGVLYNDIFMNSKYMDSDDTAREQHTKVVRKLRATLRKMKAELASEAANLRATSLYVKLQRAAEAYGKV